MKSENKNNVILAQTEGASKAAQPALANETIINQQQFELEAVYQNAPVGLCIVDTDLRWVRINKHLADINGFPVADHIGRKFIELMPQIVSTHGVAMRQVLETGRPRLGIETSRETSAQPGVLRQFRESWLPIRNAENKIIGLNVVVEEITREKQIEARLLWNKQCAEVLSELASKFLNSTRPEEIIKEGFVKIMQFLDCQQLCNYLVDDERQQLHLNAWAGIAEDKAHEYEWLDYGSTVCGCVARDGNIIIAEKIQSTSDPRTELAKSLGLRAYACYPLLRENQVIGILGFGTTNRDAFNADELDMMKTVANHTAVALNRIYTADALRQSEEKYRGIIETANEGIWTLDRAGDITFVNQRITEMLGYSPQEMLGRCAFDFFPVEMQLSVNKHFTEAIAKKSQFRGIPCKHKSGTLLWVNISCSPIYDKNGRSIGLFGMFTDISDNKRIKEELHERTVHFELVVTGTHAALWDCDLRNNRVLYSPQWKQLRGYSENEIGDQKEEWSSRLHPADETRIFEAVQRHFDGLTPFFAAEYRTRCKDGTYKWIYDYGIAQRNDSGEIVRMVGSNTDITERKLAEKKRDKENRIMALANSILEVFVEETGDALYHKVLEIVLAGMESKQGMFGYINERGDFICPTIPRLLQGHGMINISARYKGTEWQALWQRVLLEGRSLFNNEPPPVPPGHIPVHRCLVTPINFQNVSIGFLLVANKETDYTDEDLEFINAIADKIAPVLYAWIQRKLREKEQQLAEIALRASEQRYRALAEELHEADQHKNEFLAILSHELRNPLTPIKNSLFILDRALDDTKRVRHIKDVIERQVGQLTRLVDDLLDVTRITRNKIELKCARLELNALIQRTAEDYRSLFEKSEVQLQCQLCPELIYIDGDEARLAQVVGNLLQNAVKFTGRGGRTQLVVTVEADSEPSNPVSDDLWAVIRITDNGIGMTPEIISRLFQPFMQADKTLDRSRGGLGLGLALSKGLIELHGGQIKAFSNGHNQGSEFIIRLPQAEKITAVPSANSSEYSEALSRRILIIDDNIDIVESLQELLECEGHLVKAAFDGPTGLAAAEEFHPEVLLCDIGLPGMNGYEVAKAFRAHVTLKNTMLIAVSGYALPEDQQLATAAGFDHHLAKPLNFLQLARLLAKLKTGS